MLGPMFPAQDTGPGPWRQSMDIWAALGVCKDSSGALLVGQQGAAGEYTLA